MRIARAARVLAAALAFAAAGSAASAAPPGTAVRATRVTTYVPVVPGGRTIAGHCWTRSIAAQNRTDAYRCMAGNTIYDPCFASKRPRVVVCDANPASGERGFAMRLTAALPAEPPFPGRTLAPWLVQLAAAEVCIPLTGTHEAIGNDVIFYECSESRALRARAFATGLIDGGITPGRVWHARKAVYRINRAGAVTGTVTVVPLAAVWR
jgi:hypothetical protein